MTINITNPFAIGTTEIIREDTEFLRLFEPTILERIEWDDVFSKSLYYWLSSEGAGKSTILRALSPTVLRTVASYESSDPTARILRKRVQAIGPQGPTVLAIHCKSTVSYAYIQDLGLDETARKRIFFALLNARIALRGLKALTDLRGLPFPGGLDEFTYNFPDSIHGLPKDLAAHGTAADLRKWARGVEKACLDAIDSGIVTDLQTVPQHDTLIMQRLMDPTLWTVREARVASTGIIMLDDAQELTREQRTWLTETVTREREGCRVWVALRLHALETPAQFIGAQHGREYGDRRLETLWSGKLPKWRAFLLDIGNRRMLSAGSKRFKEFKDMLSEQPDAPTADGRKVREACEGYARELRTRIQERVRPSRRYERWIEHVDAIKEPYDRLLHLRAILILIERYLNTNQTALNDEPLSLAELQHRLEADELHGARAHLAREYHLPVYYGADALTYLASNNVQQFIRITERLYDAALDRELNNEPYPEVPCHEQDQIIRRLAKEKWDNIRVNLRDGEELQGLLEMMVERLEDTFLQPNQGYAPGPVGIAISDEEFEALGKREDWPDHVMKLRYLLSRALAENLLYVDDRKHHSEPSKVFWVNGLILAHFRMPVQSRQFQGATIEELANWLAYGYRGGRKPRPSMVNKRKPDDIPMPKRPTLEHFDQGG